MNRDNINNIKNINILIVDFKESDSELKILNLNIIFIYKLYK